MLKIVDREFGIFTENDRELLTIQSSKIKACMEFFRNSNYEGIQVYPISGFNFTSLDFLNDYPDLWNRIKYISIAEEVKDVSALHHLTALQYISITQRNPKIDFSFFPELEYLITAGGDKMNKLESCKKLVSLTIYYYNAGSKDFSDLPAVSWIKELHIIHSTVVDMVGLARFNNLKKVSFYFCTKLKELGCLDNSANKLTFLAFEGCRNILNFPYVGNLKKLKFLAFNNCVSMMSLSFINDIKTLKDMQFIGTDIIDGNLEPLLRLDFVAFTNRRSYTHSFARIKMLYGETAVQKWHI